MANQDLPHVLGIFLCERVLLDVLRRDTISCINIHNGMTVVEFPAVVPLVFAFAQVSGSTRGFSYQFKIADRQSREVAVSPVATVDALPSRFLAHKVISAFPGLVFQEEGMYNVVLLLDGIEVGSLPFHVQQGVPEQSPNA